MAGIQEIFTIGFIIVCIFFIPRLFRDNNDTFNKQKIITPQKLSGKLRLGIVFSVAYPLSMAFILNPWEGNYFAFIYSGILPIVLGWAGIWVKDGFKQNKSGE